MITEAEHKENLKYAQELLSETCIKVRQACGGRAAEKLRRNLEDLLSIPQEDCESESWRAAFQAVTTVSVKHMIENRIRYSNKKYRERYTPDTVRETCLICGLGDHDAEKIIRSTSLAG